MKKRTTFALICVACIAVSAIVAYAAGAGSQDDPLVSKSYVDSLVNELRTQISNSGGGGAADTFTVVEVPAGKKLECKGGTEVILRSGSAAVDSASGGVSDVTAGLDLAGGQNVTTNHHLIIPRTDGRGLSARTNIIVMVKGDYSIK